MKATLKQCEAALWKHAGVVNRAAKELGMERPSLSERIARYPRLQQAKRDAEEVVKDMAEGGLFDLIAKGDGASIRYFLSQRAKDRGYGRGIIDDDQLLKIVEALAGNAEALRALADEA